MPSEKEEESGVDDQTPEDALQSGAELVNRAHVALRVLETIRERTRVSPELAGIHDDVGAQRDALRQRLQEAATDVRRSRRPTRIRDIRFSFLDDRQRLDEWEKRVAAENEWLTSSKKRTKKVLAFWRRVQELAKQTNAQAEIREQADQVVEAAVATEVALVKPAAVIIPLQSTLMETREMVDSFLKTTSKEGPNLLEDAHVSDFTVSTAIKGLHELRGLGNAERAALAHSRDMGRRFLTSARGELAAQLLLTLMAFVGIIFLRFQAKGWREDEPEGRVARRIVDHPFASALQIGTVVGLVLFREMPTVVAVALYLVAASSGAVLFLALLTPRLRRVLYVTAAFLFADLLRITLVDLPYTERLLLIVELVAFAILLVRLLRKKDAWRELQLPESWTALVRFVVWIWLLGAGVGALAGAAGFGQVAELVGAGMLRSLYLAVVYAGLLAALNSVLWIATQTSVAQRVNFIAHHRVLVVQRIASLFTLLAFLVWISGTLGYLTLYDTFVEASTRVLKTALEVGALKISLGDILALVLGTALAVYIARLVRFVLDQDLLGRLPMSVGTREVAGSGIYWAAILIGFFATLAAAGIGLERLTVLAGAFGVGIGFGLQNVVQNFVGGLILLFGRFIKVGDKIQLDDLMGEVRAIGFRASTIRTWQGAEVIVPNSNLISDQVINWTLSDQKRRIDLDIGVAYGTDPERMLALLCEVGRANEKVLEAPPVVALFTSHGDSALVFQLRAWVTFDDFVPVSSELTVALNKRLVAEGIEIPFPQRDVNLRAIAPEAAEALSQRASPPR